MLSAVAYIATRIVAEPAWRDLMPEFLERLGQATQMSWVTLFEAHHDAAGKPVQSCRDDWAETGLALISSDPRYHNMPLLEEDGSLDEWTQRRMRGEIITANLSELTGYARQVFLEHGTHGFVSVRGVRTWSLIFRLVEILAIVNPTPIVPSSESRSSPAGGWRS